ncbi:hypothetical protein T03_7251 [Trichinella britovi]|uniref:Uncharacterized protein n=1 Tax=Trichinella britovi TaxID=45882 RepID=A0A0V1D3G2_TRIBR|nr:hypothetical protein T03_7251 [Trichinella britovi]
MSKTVGIVGNAYIDLTKEERKYVSRRHSLFYPYFSHYEILKIFTNTWHSWLKLKTSFIVSVSRKHLSEITDNPALTSNLTVSRFLR